MPEVSASIAKKHLGSVKVFVLMSFGHPLAELRQLVGNVATHRGMKHGSTVRIRDGKEHGRHCFQRNLQIIGEERPSH
jgi:hypothetical protein